MCILLDLDRYRKTKALKTVLIVDEDIVLASLLENSIKSEFPTVRASLACNGMEAIDHLKLEIPSLMILGMIMPGMTGVEVLKELVT